MKHCQNVGPWIWPASLLIQIVRYDFFVQVLNVNTTYFQIFYSGLIIITLSSETQQPQYMFNLIYPIVFFNQSNIYLYSILPSFPYLTNEPHQMNINTKTESPSQIINFLKHHPLSSALALSTLSAAAIYFFSSYTPTTPCKKRQKTQTNNQKCYLKQQLLIQHELNHLKTTRQKLIAASKDFKIQFLEQEILTNLLTEQCVLNIFDKSAELVDEEELNRIYQTSRKARRTVFHQMLINAEIRQTNRRQSLESLKSLQRYESYPVPMEMTSPRNINTLKSRLQKNHSISYPQALSFSQVYYRFVCTFEEEFKYLMEKTQKDFATFLNIDFSLITESIDFHVSKEDNEYFKQKIQEWTSGIRQSLKNKLTKYNSPIDPRKIRQILAHQIDYLNQKRQKLRETINKLGISNEEQLDALPTLLATILEDEVFFKYNIEQEQMTVDMMHLSKNWELEMLVDDFQILTQQIMQEMFQEVNKDAIQDEEAQYF